MPSKIWTFTLEDGPHTVELDYSSWNARERFSVDGELISDEYRWVVISKYDFTIGTHRCNVRLISPSYEVELLVDGQPFEMLPSQVLLRPSQEDETAKATLLRPSQETDTTAPTQLLRASQNPDPDNRDG